MDNIWQLPYIEITWRLILAGILGGLVGLERERNNHPAGFRTHILVSLGSALIMLISIYGFADFMDDPNVRFDPSRVSAQVVSGIGFLGAGTILRQGGYVSGLTTAASLWVVAAIGLAVGTGFIYGAVLVTFLALVSLELLNRLEAALIRRRRVHIISTIVNSDQGKLGELASFIAQKGATVRKVNIDESGLEEGELSLTFNVRVEERGISIEELCNEIRALQGVKVVRAD